MNATLFSGVAPAFATSITSSINFSAATAVTGRFMARGATSFLTDVDPTGKFLGTVTWNGTQLAQGIGSSGVPSGAKYVALDLNGDGLSDLVSIDPRFGQFFQGDATRTSPTSFINTGAGFRARSLLTSLGAVPSQGMISATTPVVAADLNQDGFDDLVILANDPRQPLNTTDPIPGWFYPSDGTSLSLPVPISNMVAAGD